MYVARLPPSFISVIEVQNVNYNHDLVTARVCIELQLQTTVLLNFAWNQIIFPNVKNKICAAKGLFFGGHLGSPMDLCVLKAAIVLLIMI